MMISSMVFVSPASVLNFRSSVTLPADDTVNKPIKETGCISIELVRTLRPDAGVWGSDVGEGLLGPESESK